MASNGQFPLLDAPAGNHGSCTHHPGLDICFDEHNYHNSLQALLIEAHRANWPLVLSG